MKRVIHLNEDDLKKRVRAVIEEFQAGKGFVFKPSKAFTENHINYCKKRGITEKTNPGWLYSYKRLDEASLNRMLSHGKTGMVIISSNRGEIFSDNPNTSLEREYNQYLIETGEQNTPSLQKDWLAVRNKKADNDLKRDIQSAGYSYTPVYGGYHGTDSVVDSFVPLYVVYNHSRKGADDYGDLNELYKFAITMCRKYKQDSVYIQATGQAPIYVDCNGNKVSGKSSLNFIKNDPEQEYFTTTKREKRNIPQRFTADIGFGECYVRRALTYEYVDRMRRSKLGEIFLG